MGSTSTNNLVLLGGGLSSLSSREEHHTSTIGAVVKQSRIDGLVSTAARNHKERVEKAQNSKWRAAADNDEAQQAGNTGTTPDARRALQASANAGVSGTPGALAVGCYTIVRRDAASSVLVGQLVGSCAQVSANVAFSAKGIELCLDTDAGIPRGNAFDTLDFGFAPLDATSRFIDPADKAVSSAPNAGSAVLGAGQYKQGVSLPRKLCASVNKQGLYCPILRVAEYARATQLSMESDADKNAVAASSPKPASDDMNLVPFSGPADEYAIDSSNQVISEDDKQENPDMGSLSEDEVYALQCPSQELAAQRAASLATGVLAAKSASDENPDAGTLPEENLVNDALTLTESASGAVTADNVGITSGGEVADVESYSNSMVMQISASELATALAKQKTVAASLEAIGARNPLAINKAEAFTLSVDLSLRMILPAGATAESLMANRLFVKSLRRGLVTALGSSVEVQFEYVTVTKILIQDGGRRRLSQAQLDRQIGDYLSRLGEHGLGESSGTPVQHYARGRSAAADGSASKRRRLAASTQEKILVVSFEILVRDDTVAAAAQLAMSDEAIFGTAMLTGLQAELAKYPDLADAGFIVSGVVVQTAKQISAKGETVLLIEDGASPFIPEEGVALNCTLIGGEIPAGCSSGASGRYGTGPMFTSSLLATALYIGLVALWFERR